MLLFFRMDFLRFMSESAFDSDTLEDSMWVGWRFFGADCRGPYSQVTSQSLSLVDVSISIELKGVLQGGKPIKRFGGDGLEIVLGLHPCPPRSIFQSRTVWKLSPPCYNISP
jgi:hypothetical protein